MRNCFWVFCAAVLLILSAADTAQARVKAVEFLGGYSKGDVEKGDYVVSPFMLGFDFDLGPVDFQLQPFVSAVYQPNKNIEAGNTFAFKFNLTPENWRLAPYLKVGAGFIYLSQHTREQSTQWNFLEQAGGGVHYFLNGQLGLSVEYQRRHISNAGIKRPNRGIDNEIYLLGAIYKF